MKVEFLILSLLMSVHGGQRNGRGDYTSTQTDYDWILDDETPRDEVERLLRDYEENRELVRNLGSRYYQVVYPIQMREREKIGVSTREIDNTYNKYGGPGRGLNDHDGVDSSRGQKQHFRQTSLLIKAFQHKFRLDLTLNTRLLAPNMKQKEYMKDGAVSLSPQDVEHCYYHGTVKDFQGSDFIPGSMAALQTCNGVSGIVHLGNETFVIHPFYGGDLSSKHPHVIYEYNDRRPQGCAVGQGGSVGGLLRTLREVFPNVTSKTRKTKRDVRNVAKFIETALVLDKAMFDKRPQSKRRDVIHDAIQVANIADLYFRNSLKSRLSIVYIETWQDQNQAAGFGRQRDINKALETFSNYVGKKLYQIDKDTTQLLTGQTFLNGRSTIATVGTICAGKAVGISVDINVFEPHILAANLAHAIGHNLGFEHDSVDGFGLSSAGCHCEHWHGCIMRPSVIGEEGIQPYKFSTCSANQFQQWLSKGQARCLLNKPNQIQGYNSCGNGVVDEGETCDCGSPKNCRETNPCCDPITCQLKREAECSAGACCDDNCKLRRRGYPCRQETNECDLLEVCNGDSGECPLDLFVKNAIPCDNNKGYCFNGHCPTIQAQCEVLWGRKAKTADPACFRILNSGGTAEGNCGKDKYTGELKKCTEENYECGTLHCQEGASKPLIKLAQSEFTTHQKQERGKSFQCKVVRGFYELGSVEDVGMVEDGSKCGKDKICLNQTCINLRPLQSYTSCPTNPQTKRECSDHGTCSNINTCVCDNGYTGHDCSQTTHPFITLYDTTPGPGAPIPTPFVDTGSTPSNTYILKESDSDTIIMVIFLVAAVGSVFILFALMALCYRRKSALPIYDPPYMKRRMMKGYSHPNSPHPSQHITPDHTFEDGSKLSLGPPGGTPGGPSSYQGGIPSYRSIECVACSSGSREHGLQQMKRMGNHGSGHHLGSTSMLADGAYSSEKGGILKKPYGPMDVSMDKDKWMEESERGLSRLDRMSASSQNQLSGMDSISEVERKLKSLNGYHEGILEALRSASSHRGSNASSGGAPPPPPPPPPQSSSQGAHRSSAASLTEELRKQLVSDGYLDYNSAAASPGGVLNDFANVMKAASSSGPRPDDEGGVPPPQSSGNLPGPIRIRNLEDLIRQLEHSSRHMSPSSGSEDLRTQESDADRHFRHTHPTSQSTSNQYRSHVDPESESDSIESIYKLLSTPQQQQGRTRVPVHEDQAFRIGLYGHLTASSSGHHRGSGSGNNASSTSQGQQQAQQQQQSSTEAANQGGSNAGSAASSLRRHRSSRILDGSRLTSPPRTPGYGSFGGGNGDENDIPDSDIVVTPGSTFDNSEVDRNQTEAKKEHRQLSEDYLRSQILRSTSDEEALAAKDQDLEDDLDSIRSPFYKPRTPLRYPLSPQSPPSDDESSYQGSIPGTSSAAQSDRSYNGAQYRRGGGLGDQTPQEDQLQEALLRPFYLPEYKH